MRKLSNKTKHRASSALRLLAKLKQNMVQNSQELL